MKIILFYAHCKQTKPKIFKANKSLLQIVLFSQRNFARFKVLDVKIT